MNLEEIDRCPIVDDTVLGVILELMQPHYRFLSHVGERKDAAFGAGAFQFHLDRLSVGKTPRCRIGGFKKLQAYSMLHVSFKLFFCSSSGTEGGIATCQGQDL